MKYYTREQIAYFLHLSHLQVYRFCQGFYLSYHNGKKDREKIYYYSDKRKVEPVSGSGLRAKPYLYSLESFREYIKGL